MIKFKISTLKSISVIYLGFPLLIFFIGWLKLPIAILASLVLLYCLYKYVSENNSIEYETISVKNLILIIVILFIWILFSGTGGFGYQPLDYLKHNALFKDLITESWPISYQIKGKEMFLAHYLAYYLPIPTLLGGFGWKLVMLGTVLWTALGLFLSTFFWLRFIGKYSYYLVIFFILASGVQIFVLIYQYGFETGHVLLEKIRNHGYLFWLNGLTKNGTQILQITFPSNTDMLFWAPSHALPCWLGTGFLINDWKDKTLKYSPFVISLIAFWSPLVMVGMAPLLLIAILQDKNKTWLNYINLVFAPIIFGFISSFLLSINAKDLPHHLIFTDRSATDGISLKRQIFAYCYFISMEVLIWWLPAYWIIKNNINKKIKQLFWVVLILLLTIPLFQYGVWNDWCGRVSMPTLFLFHALIAYSFVNANSKQKLVLGAIFLLALAAPMTALLGSARNYKNNFSWAPPKYEEVKLIPEATKSWPIDQYVADKNTFFFKYLAKEKHK